MKGFITGGPSGAVGGFIQEAFGSKQDRWSAANQQAIISNGHTITRVDEVLPALPAVDLAQQQIPGDINFPFHGDPGAGISIGDLRLGIQEERVQASQEVRMQQAGLPMLGPFGVVPQQEQRMIRRCPPGHRLARDGLCYPKALLAKRSKLRMWPAEPACPITRSDVRALRKRESVERKLKALGKQAHLKVSHR